MLNIRGFLAVVALTAVFLFALTGISYAAPVASFYGGGEKLNRHTANGEVFRPSAMTAAHRSLRFGTRVRVTNLRNGKAVQVRINDRGPAKWTGATIDLARGAFARIASTKSGRVPVRIQVL